MSVPPSADTRFRNKCIIVTGGGGNFGRDGCLYFLLRGARVAAFDNNLTTLSETLAYAKDEMAKASFEGDADKLFITVACDVMSAPSVESAVEAAVRFFGQAPDMLWNNAGYQGHFTPTLDYSVTDFAIVMSVNVTGAFIVMQAVAKHMAGASNAAGFVYGSNDKCKFSIVNTASVAGLECTPAMVAYSASKAAVIAMTVASAKDLAPHGIRVNAISPALIGPGYMWTRQNELHAISKSPYYSTDPQEVALTKLSGVPMRRLGSIDEVLMAVAYLLSDDSTYTTATNLVIDGGVSGGLH